MPNATCGPPDKAFTPHPAVVRDAYATLLCLIWRTLYNGGNYEYNQHQEILRTEGLSKFFPGVKR